MKLYIRLLLTVPFVLVTYFYISHHDPDDVCSGMMDIAIYTIAFIAGIICCILARLAVFSKRKSKKPKAEPVSLVVTLTTLAILIFFFIYPGHNSGKLWIEAKPIGEENVADRKTLTLKQNGNFSFDFFQVDFGCTISGSFKKRGDTIFLDDKSIARVGNYLDAAYIITKKRLIPLNETDSLREFRIVQIQ